MHAIFSKGLSKLKHRGIQVLLLLSLYFLIANVLPLAAHQGLYAISVFIKDLIMWMMPLTIGLFIAHAICSFERQAPIFIIVLILFEGLSNLSSVWYAFLGGHLAADYLPPLKISSFNADFFPFWQLPFTKPQWWSADKGSLIGLFLGCLAAFSKQSVLKRRINQGKEVIQWTLTHLFSPIIPLFILGFVARMYHMHFFQHLFAHYGMLLIFLVVFLAGYMVILFFLGSGWSFQRLLRAIKNMLPATGIAFTSGCSISTMPWTIEGAAKNLQNPQFAKAVIPATINIQQIGDCITNSFLCFLIYRHFYGHNPDLVLWMNFSIVFALARFATAGILGGAIFIMLPIYETYLMFNAEMIAIILAFNVILDPLVTSSNVIANGALCRVFERVWLFVLDVARFFLPHTKK